MKRVKGGLIISAAGIDGCGKTTQLFRIATYLANRDYDVVRTSAISENCTEVGRRIGAIMTDPDLDGILPDESEATLMIAARVENWRNVIRPALEDGKIVVSDRFQTCFAIYQDLDFQVARRRLMEFGLNREADLEIILDIPPSKIHAPLDTEGNRLERKPGFKWREMRWRYQQVAAEMDWAVQVDAARPADEVWEDIKAEVDRLLEIG